MFYLLFAVMHWWVPLEVTDSEGFTHSVRRRLTANFDRGIAFLFPIDLFCLCPAHYFLTLYDATRAVEWQGHGSARDKVEAVAEELGSLTRAEAIHFTVTLVPVFGALALHSVVISDWQSAFLCSFFVAVFVCGQRFYGLLGRPRAAIVRFRGPGTAAYAWGALKGTLVLAVLFLIWSARGGQFWIDEPTMLMVEPPKDLLSYPDGAEIQYATDVWTGLACPGIITNDPAEPWLINVTACGDAMASSSNMFMQGGFNSSTPPNATLPTQWTARGFRYSFSVGWPMAAAGLAYPLFYLPVVGQGTFAGMRELTFSWSDLVAGAILFGYTVQGWVTVRVIEPVMHVMLIPRADRCMYVSQFAGHVISQRGRQRGEPRVRLVADENMQLHHVPNIYVGCAAAVQGLHC
jgi:hypothetical protein